MELWVVRLIGGIIALGIPALVGLTWANGLKLERIEQSIGDHDKRLDRLERLQDSKRERRGPS